MASLPTKLPPRRLPTLTISPNAHSLNNDFIISPDTPDEYYTPLSSTSSESITFSAFADGDEKLAQDLAVLEKLRRSVHLNLQLRPISSSSRQGQRSPIVVSPTVCSPVAVNPFRVIYPESLVRRLSSPRRPLLIDTRSTTLFHSSRISESVNIIIPSLMLKRQRKAPGGVTSVHSLRSFVTTEAGRRIWDDLLSEQGPWDGVVIIYDEDMDDRERDSALSWNLLSLIDGIFQSTPNAVMYLHGGINAFRRIPNFRSYLTSDEEDNYEDDNYHFSPIAAIVSSSIVKHSSPLSQSPRSTPSPQTEDSTSRTPRVVPSVTSSSPDSSPKSVMLDANNTPSQFAIFTKPFLDTVVTHTPPPGKQLHHRASQPNLHDVPSYSIRKASVPNLHRLDTSFVGRLSIKTQNPPHATISRMLTLPAPLEGSSKQVSSPRSPSFLSLSLRGDNSSFTYQDQGAEEGSSRTPVTAYFTATSGPPILRPTSPMTARPLPTSPTSEVPTFTVSCILPNFLFLGSELITRENVKELQDLGVKRILNLAAECDPDDHGLDLRNSFERYIKIAMRDTVEEENVNQGVREVCECLGEYCPLTSLNVLIFLR